MISSLQNPAIKHLIKLRDSRVRRGEKTVLIEGSRECACALKANLKVRNIFICQEGLTESDRSVTTNLSSSKSTFIEVSKKVFEKISFGNRNEGIIMIADEPTHTLSSLRLGENPLMLITDAIEKPGNLGAMIRTADAAGCDAVISTNARLDIYNHNVIRTSLGSVFNTPVLSVTTEEIREWLVKKKIQIVIAHPETSQSYLSINYQQPTAFVLGREDTGVSMWWHEHASHKVAIPMHGAVNSLNVSVTAAILIYEALRQRQ